MLLYVGKLDWKPYGDDELFVVIVPKDNISAGDPIYTFFQWTKDAQGNVKKNWFQKQTVVQVTKVDDNDSTFTTDGGYYSWVFQTQQARQRLEVTMSNPNDHKSTMNLNCEWKSNGDEPEDSLRIWTGKLTWPQYADNELFLAVVPHGFGEGKPVVALWQWTVNASNKPKFPCILKATQTGGSDDSGIFSFTDYYTMKCSWDSKTQDLAIHMQEPNKHGQDIGPFEQSAILSPLSHDLTPRQAKYEKASLDVCYPQPEVALQRISTPMPFPPTLVETLTHTASFVDQAGYLAQYAVNRYTALDRLYQEAILLANGHKREIKDLRDKINADQAEMSRMAYENNAAREKLETLQKQFYDAREVATKREAEFQKQVSELQKTITKDQEHDAADHKALDEAHETIQKEQEAKNVLRKSLDEKELALTETQTKLQNAEKEKSVLKIQIAEVSGQLAVETSHNVELEAKTSELKKEVAKLSRELATSQRNLTATKEELSDVKAECDGKDAIIQGLESGFQAVKKDRDAKAKALDDLKAKMKDLTASWQPLTTEIYPYQNDSLPRMKESIDQVEDQYTWAQMSDWIGSMSNRGQFFNSLEHQGPSAKLVGLDIYAGSDWITGFVVRWEHGYSQAYGLTNGDPAASFSQTSDSPIVAVTAVVDDTSARSSYKPVANLSCYGFSKEGGYHQQGEYRAPHAFGPWLQPLTLTALAPALDGSWCLHGVYGYYDGSLDAVGFIWAKL